MIATANVLVEPGLAASTLRHLHQTLPAQLLPDRDDARTKMLQKESDSRLMIDRAASHQHRRSAIQTVRTPCFFCAGPKAKQKELRDAGRIVLSKMAISESNSSVRLSRGAIDLFSEELDIEVELCCSVGWFR